MAAGLGLVRGGEKPLLIDRASEAGGLMRPVRWEGFVVDLGRKEFYSRIPVVDRLWRELLGEDYRPYPHRSGVLCEGRLLELSPVFRGLRRGLSWGLCLACAGDHLWSSIRPDWRPPRNYEEYRYRIRGRLLSRLFHQGFNEKFRGIRWRDLPPPDASGRLAPHTPTLEAGGMASGAVASIRERWARSRRRGGRIWRHPARGSGQVAERLVNCIQSGGGEILLGARLVGLEGRGGRVDAIQVEITGETLEYEVEHLVSSQPLQQLVSMLPTADLSRVVKSGSVDVARGTVLVYLFFDRPPRFPHSWIDVTCPTLRIGRVTNYAAFGGEMVPPGQSCLCVEFFVADADPLLQRTDRELTRQVLDECAGADLIFEEALQHSLVIRLPGADAAARPEDWRYGERAELLEAVTRFRNLYHVNRAGTDEATMAGLWAADAILGGDRRTFDQKSTPSRAATS